MANSPKVEFLEEVKKRVGSAKKFGQSQSLFEIGNDIRLYIRYSKVHGKNRTFYGLRESDLRQLQGHQSLICFLWDDQTEPLLIPYSEFEAIFETASPANDGQYKVQIFLINEGSELYIARAGRFNIERFIGWNQLPDLVESRRLLDIPQLSHNQIQTILGAIGITKGFDVFVPSYDKGKLDWAFTTRYECRQFAAKGYESISSIVCEIDVIWYQRGSTRPSAFFEVEHSTPIYSALLRFNDVLLTYPEMKTKFSIVANDTRRSLFARQVNRPTFQLSHLNELCTFLEYGDAYAWYKRIGPRV